MLLRYLSHSIKIASLGDTYIDNTELNSLKAELADADNQIKGLITALTAKVEKTESDIASLVSNKADVTLVTEKVEELKGLINSLDAVKNNYLTADEELKNQLTTVINNAKQQAIDSAAELVNNAKTELNAAIASKADNATIIDTEISAIRLIGGGSFKLKNVIMRSDLLISLREDFGCTWHGDIEIENVRFYNNEPKSYIFGALFYPHHNFGYQAYYPENIKIKNVSLRYPGKLCLFNDITPGDEYDITAERVTVKGEETLNVNRMMLPKSIEISGIGENVTEFVLSPDKIFAKQLEEAMKGTK